MLTRLAFEAANAGIAIAVIRIIQATVTAKAVFIIAPFTQTMSTLPWPLLSHKRKRFLAIVCTNNPCAVIWQPAEGTCERLAAEGDN